MLKIKRKNMILKHLEDKEFVKVIDLQRELNVTEMTIRRDLDELEKEGALLRVHGGAKKVKSILYTELSHSDRAEVNVDKKLIIAKKAAQLIEDNDIIFISASTTNEMLYGLVEAKNVRVVTNCLYIYMQFMKDSRFDSLLIGGKFNEKLESFLGASTSDCLSRMNFTKAFVGTNGISNNNLSASNDEEGLLHRIALDNSKERYIVCDSTKFDKDAFYNFYTCDKVDAVICDLENIKDIKRYQLHTKLI